MRSSCLLFHNFQRYWNIAFSSRSNQSKSLNALQSYRPLVLATRLIFLKSSKSLSTNTVRKLFDSRILLHKPHIERAVCVVSRTVRKCPFYIEITSSTVTFNCKLIKSDCLLLMTHLFSTVAEVARAPDSI